MRRRLSPRDSAKILGWPDGGERMRPPGPSPSPSPFQLPRSLEISSHLPDDAVKSELVRRILFGAGCARAQRALTF